MLTAISTKEATDNVIKDMQKTAIEFQRLDKNLGPLSNATKELQRAF
jgi:hypothetical protein